jgi:hypothetical protein
MLNDGDVSLRDILPSGGYTVGAYMIKKLVENVISSEAERRLIARPLRLRLTQLESGLPEHRTSGGAEFPGRWNRSGLERIDDEIVDTTLALHLIDPIKTNFRTFGKIWMPHGSRAAHKTAAH